MKIINKNKGIMMDINENEVPEGLVVDENNQRKEDNECVVVDIEATYDALELIISLPKSFCRCCGRVDPPCKFDSMFSSIGGEGIPSYASPLKCKDCWKEGTIDPWARRYGNGIG